MDHRRGAVEIGRRLAFASGLPAWFRVLLVGAAFSVYAASFLPVHRAIGPAAAAFSIFPVLVAGALLGQSPGALSGLLLIPLNYAVFRLADPMAPPLADHLPPSLGFAFIGGVIGRLRDLGGVLRGKQAELEESLRRQGEAHLALMDREIQLLLAQEVAHIGNWVWEIATGKLSWSAELFRILGLNPEAATPTYELFLRNVHPDDRAAVREAVERALLERIPFDLEHRIVRADGQVRSMHSRGQILADGSGQPIKMIGTGQDITERKEMQAQLILSERMASLGTLAGGVAHEINNPLSYVTSNVRFIAEELADLGTPAGADPLAEMRKAVEEALEGAERVRRIVHDLSAFSRADERRGPVDLHLTLDRAINIASSQIRYRARLVKEYAAVPPVDGNESRLGQVFLNLLVNAAQAIPEGRPDDNEIRVVTRRCGADRVLVEIRDTGCGIPQGIRDRIFEPFFTTKPVGTGTGLGLSICHRIVRSLGGELTFESEAGKGSTFRIALSPARLGS